MAKRKSFISMDFYNFREYAEKLDKLGADLKEVIGDAMEHAGEKVQEDTKAALAKGNLPAQGRYSQGDTEASVERDIKVEWSGSVGTIGLGFDKTKPGAGGFLITGTPRHAPNHPGTQPVRELEDIYGRRKYEQDLKKSIEKELQEAIDKRMGG